MGQHLLSSFVGCSLQHSIAELEVPGEACGLQIHMKHCGLAEERLCCVRTTSLSPFYPYYWQSSLQLCSLQLHVSGNNFGPGLKCGLFIPGGGGPSSPGRRPAGLADPCRLRMVPQVCWLHGLDSVWENYLRFFFQLVIVWRLCNYKSI